MVLYKLYACTQIGLVELVGYVPPQGTKLPPLLHGGVEEGHRVQHRLPLLEVGDVQLVLGDTSVGASEACLDTLWGLIGELDAGLQQAGEGGGNRWGRDNAGTVNSKHTRHRVSQSTKSFVGTKITTSKAFVE